MEFAVCCVCLIICTYIYILLCISHMSYISLRILGYAHLMSFVDVIVFWGQTPTTMNFDVICG